MSKCGGVCHVFKNGCKIHEYEDCFVVTDPKGLNIGESKTKLGAAVIAQSWERDQDDRKRKAKAKVSKNIDQDLLKALWGSRKVTRLNKIRNTQYFGPLTVRELATLVLLEKGDFPKGLDTPSARETWRAMVLSTTSAS